MSSPIVERTVCLLLDKREFECRSRLTADFNPQFFRVGEGSLFPAESYGHINIEPGPRSGYPAWRKRPNSYNAFLSFQKIIRSAKDDGVKTLLLLEDDAYKVPEFDEVFQRGLLELEEVDPEWELLYLGANHTFSKTTEVSSSLLRLSGSGCFHAVVVRASIFPLILDLSPTAPIDEVVAKRIHPRGHSYGLWPNVVLTRPGYSHCEGRDVDYSHLFKNKGC